MSEQVHERADQLAISFRVPADLAREIEECAALEYLSVAAFCRRGAAHEVHRQRVAKLEIEAQSQSRRLVAA